MELVVAHLVRILYIEFSSAFKICHLIDGLRAELRGDLNGALSLYRSPANVEHISQEEEDIIFFRTVDCCEKLGKWGLVSACIGNSVDDDFQSLWDEDFRDLLMEKFLHCNINQALSGSRSISIKENLIYPFISASLKDETERKFLIDHYANVLAIISIMVNDMGEASYYVQKSFDSFSKSWSTTHELSFEHKLKLLENLTKVIREKYQL